MFQAGIQHSRAAMNGALQGLEPGKYSGGMARDAAGGNDDGARSGYILQRIGEVNRSR
jgi:hypothetical protein